MREEWICSECWQLSYWAPVPGRLATADRAWPVTLHCPAQHLDTPHYRTNTDDGKELLARATQATLREAGLI